MLKLIKDRDKLIDILILSHIKSLGRIYALETKGGMRRASKLAVDYFAKDDIIDEKLMLEMGAIFEMDIPDQEMIKLAFDEDRPKQLASMLSGLAKMIRIKALKDFDTIEYQTKY